MVREWLACVAVLASLSAANADEHTQEEVRHLVRQLQQGSGSRAAAMDQLEKLGPAARAAVPVLLKLLRDTDAGQNAASALLAIDPDNKEAVEVAAAGLSVGDADHRANAARVLSVFGTKARAAVPALARALGDREPLVRVLAAEALGKVGAGDRRAVAALAQALRDPERLVRLQAAISLADADPHHPACVPALASGLADLQLLAYLKALGPAAREVFAPLLTGHVGTGSFQAVRSTVSDLEMIRRWNSHERECVAQALGRIGPPAKAAVPALRAALRAPHATLREDAAQALEKIMGEGLRP
jgi:HEAT repeat protein